ncbi:hypothetical protein CBL_04663 [Carabus blaptoides fortunei]
MDEMGNLVVDTCMYAALRRQRRRWRRVRVKTPQLTYIVSACERCVPWSQVQQRKMRWKDRAVSVGGRGSLAPVVSCCSLLSVTATATSTTTTPTSPCAPV